MTNDERRKAFEAWLCPHDDDAMKRLTLEKRGDGDYAQALPRLQWKVWQAATAAERGRIVNLAAKQGWAMKNEDPFEDAVREICAIRKG